MADDETEEVTDLHTWNAYLQRCGCCTMPEIGLLWECEIKEAQVGPCGYNIKPEVLNGVDGLDFWVRYKLGRQVFQNVSWSWSGSFIWGGDVPRTFKNEDETGTAVAQWIEKTDPPSDDDENPQPYRFCDLREKYVHHQQQLIVFADGEDGEGDIFDQLISEDDYDSQRTDDDGNPIEHHQCTSTHRVGSPDIVETEGTSCTVLDPSVRFPEHWMRSGFSFTASIGDNTWNYTDPAPVTEASAGGWNYSGLVTFADLDDEVARMLALQGFIPSPGPTLTPCNAHRLREMDSTGTDPTDPASERVPDPDLPSLVVEQQARFRWRVPADHTGDYFRVEWDQIVFPDDGSDPDPDRDVTPCFWEWDAGPGPVDDPDSDAWFSDWIDLVMEAHAYGTLRILNIRYYAYEDTPYGRLPQRIGDTYEFPESP